MYCCHVMVGLSITIYFCLRSNILYLPFGYSWTRWHSILYWCLCVCEVITNGICWFVYLNLAREVSCFYFLYSNRCVCNYKIKLMHPRVVAPLWPSDQWSEKNHWGVRFTSQFMARQVKFVSDYDLLVLKFGGDNIFHIMDAEGLPLIRYLQYQICNSVYIFHYKWQWIHINRAICGGENWNSICIHHWICSCCNYESCTYKYSWSEKLANGKSSKTLEYIAETISLCRVVFLHRGSAGTSQVEQIHF